MGLRARRPICHDCRRSPLIGERVYLYERGQLVCALCRPSRKQEPLRADIVHGAEYGHTVQRVAA